MTRNNLSLFFRSFLGVICGSTGKEIACNVGGVGSIPGLGRSPGEGNGNPLQYSGLENYGLYSPWGRKEFDTIKCLTLLHLHFQRLDALRFSVSTLEEGRLLSLLAIWCTSHLCHIASTMAPWEIASYHIQGNISGNRD